MKKLRERAFIISTDYVMKGMHFWDVDWEAFDYEDGHVHISDEPIIKERCIFEFQPEPEMRESYYLDI